MTNPTAIRPRALSALALLVALVSCAPSGRAGSGPGDGSGWSALARERTEPLAEAPRVALTEIEFVPEPSWGGGLALDPGVALLELVGAGLLRRADVNWVERRRFDAAVERARTGQAAPSGAPPTGQSDGARWIFGGMVIATGDSTTFSLRLTEAATSQVRHGWRSSLPGQPDPVTLARHLARELRRGLAEVEAPPEWSAPGGDVSADPDIPREAVVAFARGISAEDRYDWSAARAAYQAAISRAGDAFVEADEALARAARMRQGSSLGGG